MALLLAVGKAGLVILVVIVVACRVMPEVLDRVARLCSPPVFLLSIVAICFGTAYLTSLAGVSVSLGASLAVLLVKTALTTVAAVVVRVPWRTALATGLLLAQVGEFSFMLLDVGTDAGLSPLGLGDDGVQVVVAATVLLMVFSPLLAAAGPRVERWPGGTPVAVACAAEEEGAEDAPPLTEHVVIIGMGPAALEIAAALRAREVPVLMTTLNPDGAAAAEARGHSVLRGDLIKAQVLREAGVPAARVVVIAEDDAETGAQLVSAARALTRSVLENLDLPLASSLGSSQLVDTSRVVRFPWHDVGAPARLSLLRVRGVLQLLPPAPRAR